MVKAEKKLLFVDDEPNILEMLRRMLGLCDAAWEGTFCSSVDEALDALRQTVFDTVVCDIRMPHKDGFVLIQAMGADARLRDIPVIVLTGEADRTLKRRVLDMGAADLLNKPVTREDLVARIRSALRLKEYHDRLQDQVALLDGLVRERTRQLEHSYRKAVWRLAKAGEYRDDQTGMHVARVAWCSRILAEGVSMPPDAIDCLFQASPLHDIGKIGIPDAILLKPGKLTAEERETMERHVIIGERILRDPPKMVAMFPLLMASEDVPVEYDVPFAVLRTAGVIARHHHEKWDGSGYPDSLAGEDIPEAARIVALTDVYDALVSERPYKAPLSPSDAACIVRDQSGHHFDPRMAEVFLASFDRINEVYEHFDETLAGPKAGEPCHANHSVCG